LVVLLSITYIHDYGRFVFLKGNGILSVLFVLHKRRRKALDPLNRRSRKKTGPLEILLLLAVFCFAAPSGNAAEVSVVSGGRPASAHFIGKPWVPGEGRLASTGNASRLYADQAIETGDFRVTARLVLPKLTRQNPEIGIGPYSYIQLDANGGRIIIGGPLFVPDEQMIRYTIIGKNDGRIVAGEPFIFEAVGANGQIKFHINGELMHTTPLLRSNIGPLSLFPAAGAMEVLDFRIAADKLSPYAARDVTAYGVALDPRLRWRPDLRKANYVKLADGALAYLTGLDLMITHDLGGQWERRKGTIQSDAFGDTLGFSGGMLLRTRENSLVAVVVNSKNYVHLEWDEGTDKAISGTREVWTLRSVDEGRTWIDVQRIYPGYCGALVDMIQTSTGNIVVPVQEFDADANRHITRAYVSEDDAKTWIRGNTLDIGGRGNHAGAFEPTLAELDSGRIIMLMRTNLDYLWAAYADTDGRYWRETRPSQFDASSSPAYMRRLESGRIALLWNRVYPEGKTTYRRRVGKWSETSVSWCREEVSFSITDPTGQNWSDPVVIARKPGLWMAYPYLFEPEPGVIWVFASGGLSASFREVDFVTTP
jgi:sialidase-1